MSKFIAAFWLIAALAVFMLVQFRSMAFLDVEAERVRQIQLTHLDSGVTAVITNAA